MKCILLKAKSYKLKACSHGGQIMLLTVLAIGSTLLGATTIAGLLMLYQIRQSGDLANSAKAIFAADAGSEWALYNFSCANFPTPGEIKQCPMAALTQPLSNGARVAATCFDNSSKEISCGDSTMSEIRSVGTAGSASRALRVTF